jgi:polynucleotide 5'-kinase involved in rRNA processing
VTTEQPYGSLRERLHGTPGVVMLIGAPDTGKTTLGKLLVADAVSAGMSAAFVDGDVAASTVGPPACAGLKWVRHDDDIANLSTADELRFVGSTEPQAVVLPHVVSVSSLVQQARTEAEFVVLDTSGVVSGVIGQTIKYHLWELCRPDLVIAMHRGDELEPIVGMLRRFLSARIAMAEPLPEMVPLSPVDRYERRAAAFAAALGDPLQRWRVQTTVFAPTLPEEFDRTRLESMLVGVQDDHGECLGLGVLEVSDGVVRVATRFGEEMRGLRLGSMRVDLRTYETQRVRLRELIFGI